MISDRELSALVATKVMGWAWCVSTRIFTDGVPLRVLCPPSGDTFFYYVRTDQNYGRPWDGVEPSVVASDAYREVPSFATDAGLALEAAMKARGGLSVEIVPQSSGKFMVPREDIGDKPTYTYGSTLARALSLYALHAVGVDVEDDSSGRGE